MFVLGPVVALLIATGAPPEGMVFLPSAEVATGCRPLLMKPHMVLPPPVRLVRVPGFFLDRTEVTVAAYRKCIEAGACTSPAALPELSNLHVPGRDTHPVTALDWEQAAGYCRWAGKRLPSEPEWDRAAQGPAPSQDPYVWGQAPADCAHVAGIAITGQVETDPGLCLRHDLTPSRPLTLPVCSRPKGNSREGICDLIGNVSEWIGAWFVPRPPSRVVANPKRLADCDRSDACPEGRWHILKGSAAKHDSRDDRERWSCLRPPTRHFEHLGMRCAKDVLPGG